VSTRTGAPELEHPNWSTRAGAPELDTHERRAVGPTRPSTSRPSQIPDPESEILDATQRRERITAPAAPSLELAELGLGETLVAATSVHVDHARQTFVTSRAGGMEHGGHGDPCHFGLRSRGRIAVLHGDWRRRTPSWGSARRCGRDSFTALGGTRGGICAGMIPHGWQASRGIQVPPSCCCSAQSTQRAQPRRVDRAER